MDLIQRAINLGFELKNDEYHPYELQKWLRETHNIQMIMQPYYDHYGIPKVTFVCDVICINDGLNDGYKHKSKKCNTYEEALEIGLNNGLKLIKNI